MNEFSFLDYLDNYSYENLLVIERAAQLKNRQQLAEIIGISHETIKGWFIESRENKRKREPNAQSWNLLLYSLEANRLGYKSLKDIFNNI
ncbi:hypothetical protein KTJ20_09965 [Acinetobacter ursingii]|uniref:hypothetical protein n=1 Tax=Acinetobacter ursingii TaxID=108980 RepID=UPI0021CDD3D5|nr:hypothetical protein [Acinetobacter ursingii]MCU4589075.1 hypothetical protein [Acinetobacter ursingii]